MTALDDSLEEAGGFGVFQIVFVAAASIFRIVVAANLGASIFEAFTPSVQCKSPFESKAKEICPDSYQQMLVPEKDGKLSYCYRFNFTDTFKNDTLGIHSNHSTCGSEVNISNAQVVRCESWNYDQSVMRHTIVTDFDLVCRNRWGGYLSQSALMMGVAIGSIFTGYISDRFGRRRALLIVCIGMTVTGGLLSITNSYISYSIMRSVSGLFAFAPGLVLFVYTMEITSPKYRSTAAQMLQLAFPLGFSYLALVSYCLREWRSVQLAISLPSIAGLLVWWATPESPRWLMTNNRESEAFDVIEKISKINRSKTLPSGRQKFLSTAIVSENKASSFRLLFKTPSLRNATLRLFYTWFAVSCVYYGLTLNAADLSGNPFGNVLINAGAEAVASLTTILLLNVCGRRPTVTISFICAGLLCILVPIATHTTVATFLAMFGKFAISISFATLVITSNEIYPTEIRSFATGLCNAMTRLGGVVSPLVAMLGIANKDLPYVIFGAFSLIAGLVMITLPETKGVPLPQTIADGVQLLRRSPSACSSFAKGKYACCGVENRRTTTKESEM